jgi:hypothetical protein
LAFGLLYILYNTNVRQKLWTIFTSFGKTATTHTKTKDTTTTTTTTTSDWRTSLHVHEHFPTDKQTLTDGPLRPF